MLNYKEFGICPSNIFWTIVLKTGRSDFGEELASSIRQTAQPAANRQLAIRKHHWTQVFSKTPTDS